MMKKEIVGGGMSEVLELLNKTFVNEWFTYYHYWVGIKTLRGPMREKVIAELEEQASDELQHAEILTERIVKLGGTPILKPGDWYKTNISRNAPVGAVLEQCIKNEQRMIHIYNGLLETMKDKDPVTSNLVMEILKDEMEHVEALYTILEDIVLEILVNEFEYAEDLQTIHKI
jgi:bacterioferritin